MRYIPRYLHILCYLTLILFGAALVFILPGTAHASAPDKVLESLYFPMDVRITYMSTDGEVLGLYETRIDAREETRLALSVPSPSYEGYVLSDDGDAIVTGSMIEWGYAGSNQIRHGGGNYTVFYEKAGCVRIFYRYDSGAKALEDKVSYGKVGSLYSVPSEQIPGYRASRQTVSGYFESGTLYFHVSYDRIYHAVSYETGENGSLIQGGRYPEGTYVVSSEEPSRPGKTFLGWADSEGGAVQYDPGDTVSLTRDRTFYAIYSDVYYPISFELHGGTGNFQTAYKAYGEDYVLPETGPSKAGCTFMGWSETEGGSLSYLPGMTFYGNRAVTFHAVYTELKTYTVSYHGNGGDGGPASQIKIQGVDLKLTTAIPERPGYRFVRWAGDTMFQTIRYLPGETYREDQSINLYAIWEKRNYNVIYDANGGDGGPYGQNFEYMQTVRVPDAVPTRQGYEFLGWGLGWNDKTPVMFPGDEFLGTHDFTVYAVYEKNEYDLSVTGLSADPESPLQYGSFRVFFRVSNLDTKKSYTGVPCVLTLDGEIVFETELDLSPSASYLISCDVRTGSLKGHKELKVVLNGTGMDEEIRQDNNTVRKNIYIRELRDVGLLPLTLSGEIYEGDEVIVPFALVNYGDNDRTPEDYVQLSFALKTIDEDGELFTVETYADAFAVVPSNMANLVYVRVTIPEDGFGKTYYVTAGILPDADNMVSENDHAVICVNPKKQVQSRTPDARYESHAPASYDPSARASSGRTVSAVWSEYRYADGAFVLCTYSVRADLSGVSVRPDGKDPYATTRVTRSGYGLVPKGKVRLKISGDGADAGAITAFQHATVTYPEYAYSSVYGNYDTVPVTEGQADLSGFAHDIPIYVRDGAYKPKLTVSGIWTPAGEISASALLSGVTVRGNLYDDYYIRETGR